MDAKRTTVRDMRRSNRSVLLSKIYLDGPLSRHELAESTSLSPASVSNARRRAHRRGPGRGGRTVESDGGRPRVLLRVAPGFGYVIGVDVGETRVQVELFDMSMAALAKADYPIESPDPPPAESWCSHILDGLARGRRAGRRRPEPEILGVGVAVSGVVDSGEDGLVHAQTLGWDGVPLGAMLRAGTDHPDPHRQRRQDPRARPRCGSAPAGAPGTR